MVALLGIALLLATPFLTAYSYTVTTTSADAKMITISYVYPLEPFLLVFLTLGIVMTTYGLWNARRLLVAHKSIPVALGWLAIAVASLLSNSLTNITLLISPSPPVWATGTDFSITPTYGLMLLTIGSTLTVLSLLGVWMSRKLLQTHRTMVTIAFSLGALLTILSALWAEHMVAVSYEVYQRGFPLPWLSFPLHGLVVARGWFPTAFFVFDLVFWSSLAYGSVLLAMRLTPRVRAVLQDVPLPRPSSTETRLLDSHDEPRNRVQV